MSETESRADSKSKAKKTRAFGRWQRTTSSLGVEITDHAVKVTEVTFGKNGECQLSNWAIEPLAPHCVEDGIVKDAEQVILALRQALIDMNATKKLKTKSVHLALPSQHVMMRFLELPNINHKDLKKLIEFEIKHNIHLPFARPYYDFAKLDDPGSIGETATASKTANSFWKSEVHKKQVATAEVAETSSLSMREVAASSDDSIRLDRLDLLAQRADDHSAHISTANIAPQCDVLLVAANLDIIEQFTSIAKTAGLKPESVEIKALSLQRLIQKTQFINDKGTYVIVELNEGAMELCLYHEGKLRVARHIIANIPDLGAMTAATFGRECDELAYEIERLMNFFRYTLNNRDSVFEHIIVSGDVPGLTEIKDQFAQRFSESLTILRPDHLVSQSMDLSHILPSLSAPLGLALRGNER